MKHYRRFLSLLIIIFSIQCVTLTAFAENWYDVIHSGTYTPIKGQNFVAETFYGVDALYNENDTKYQCNELISRFYKEAYDLEVFAWGNTGLMMLSKGYAFEVASTPKPGDVVFAPAKYRNNKSDHWAIVKSYSNGTITLFEQNVVSNGRAGTGRTLDYPSPYYTVYTPVAQSGYPSPKLHTAGSQPADEPEQVTDPPRSTRPLTKPTEASTTVSATNATTNTSTTAKSNSSTKATTKKASSTTLKPSTTSKTKTTSASTKNNNTKNTSASSNLTTENKEKYTSAIDESVIETIVMEETLTEELTGADEKSFTTSLSEIDAFPKTETENASENVEKGPTVRNLEQTRRAIIIGAVLTACVIGASIVVLEKKNQDNSI